MYFLIENLLNTPTHHVLFYLLVLLFLVECFYFYFFFIRVPVFSSSGTAKQKEENLPPVSVIICARNERDNLLKHLPLILEQNYPNFEVIVVNDGSTDDSEDILKSFSLQYPHFSYTFSIPNKHYYFSKKQALTIGLKKARYDIVLLTDADCYPTSDQWIKKIMELYNPSTSIVLGYSPYRKEKGILNQWIRFDAYYIALQYFSFAMAGIPYMGVGRNLSYRKELFFKNKGFATHFDLQSGDDDLFVNAHATSKNTATCLAPESFMISIPKKKLSHWIWQKKRHASTGSRYKLLHKILLGIHHFNYFAFHLTCLLLPLFLYEYLALCLLLFITRQLLVLPVFYYSMKKLKSEDLFVTSLMWEAWNKTFYVYLFILSFSNSKKQYPWK